MKVSLRFWTAIVCIWLLSTFIDRAWWNLQNGIPSWDQADYLNSALDHGRALGILPGGEWKGWNALLDLSPKIPPLASVINGSVIALVGDAPAKAAWSLSLWNCLLMVSVAGWGLQLRSQSLGIIGVCLTSITPALLQLRTDYVLEMPLTAASTFALWRLSCWWDPIKGGRWPQALIAAAACSIALLIKQSALLILVSPFLWIGILVYRRNKKTRRQIVLSISIIFSSIIPWFHHNWITILSGTNRAVFESAIKEGDPTFFTIDNWFWYLRVISKQLGPVILFIGFSGCLLWVLKINNYLKDKENNIDNNHAWIWLIINLIGGWFFTTLSPNKDPRYITPILPSLILLISRGWVEWGYWINHFAPSKNNFKSCLAFLTCFGSTIPMAWQSQVTLLNSVPKGPLPEIIEALAINNPNGEATTVIVIPSTPDLNQHNVSYYGRRQGGQLVGRQLGNSEKDIDPVLNNSQWIILAESDFGSVRKSAIKLDLAIRRSNIFRQINTFRRPNGSSYSLWKRDESNHQKNNFPEKFIAIASGMQNGPIGIKKVFDRIDLQHMLDGHYQYKDKVNNSSLEVLLKNPDNLEAHWSLALLAILSNRPNEAAIELNYLKKILPNNPWPSAYLSIIYIADWNPWLAMKVANDAKSKYENPVIYGLSDVSAIMGGCFWRLPSAYKSIPKAIKFIEAEINES